MPRHLATITIIGKKYTIPIECFGTGDIPIIIVGQEMYGELLKRVFQHHGLLEKFQIIMPKLYWCEDSPLASLPESILTQLTMKDLATHLEEIRHSLAKKNLIESINQQVGIYGHSGFSALAFHYSIFFPQYTLFIEAEAPPPFFTAQWATEKGLFFKGNASAVRFKALTDQGLDPEVGAVDAKSMDNFSSFRDAYHRMNATLWYDFYKDHRKEIWGNRKLNMIMLRHYFQNLLANYDCRNIQDKITCPVHISLGIIDTAVPPYLLIDSPKQGGIGFFNQKKRDYHIFSHSGHWPALEESAEYCKKFEAFIAEQVKSHLNRSGNLISKL